jgi:hypothetical protein
MKQATHFLIVLLFLAPFDDAWATFPVLSFPSFPDDNDEYLPQEREQSKERSAAGQPVLFLRLNADDFGSFTGDRRRLSRDLIIARQFDPAPLYVFMSLQC